MADYSQLALTASQMLAAHGASMTLKRKVEGEYDPETGDVLEDRVTSHAGFGVKAQYTAREIDGTRIRSGDARVYLTAQGVPRPLTGDVLAINGEAWTVVNADAIQPGSVTLLYDVQVRL